MRIAPLLALTYSVAHACVCVSDGKCPGSGTSVEPVFIGTVLSVEIQNPPDLPLPKRKARIRIDKAYTGIALGTREVDVWTGSGGGDCGFPFETGKSYLVEASQLQGRLGTNICGFTRELESAGAVLQILDRRRDGRDLPSITGLIESYDLEIRDRPTVRHRQRLTDRLIRLQSGDRTIETRSDKDGVFAFDSVPPGNYRVLPDLPVGTRVFRIGESDDVPRSIQIGTGTCKEYDIRLLPAGSIEGHIRDTSDQPVKPLSVYLLSSETALPADARQIYSVFSRTGGAFRFQYIPPGRYILLVNAENNLSQSQPYRRSYYPGVSARAAAELVTVDGGRISGVDIRVDRASSVRPVTVQLTWLGGRPVDHLMLVRAASPGAPDSSASAFGSGPVALGLQPGREYRIDAEVACPVISADGATTGPTLRSGEMRLESGDDPSRLMLTIPATGCPETQR